MLLPADRLLELLQGEWTRPGETNDAGVDVSSRQSAAMALQLLRVRERNGARAVLEQGGRLAATLHAMAGCLPPGATRLHGAIDDLRNHSLNVLHGGSAEVATLEANWRRVLFDVEKFAAELRSVPGLDAATRTRLVDMLASWESADLVEQAGQGSASSATAAAEEVNDKSLLAYLRDRFAEPSLQVTAFRPLPGGFGKQTYLFTVTGQALAGDFVMRRDFVHPLIDNDCHRIRNEYEVIRAVHGRGFPAPEALWLDMQHHLLPGGDFIVMRRSPGTSGGTVLKPNARVSDALTENLAGILARLHALPPIVELAGLNESINREVWAMRLDQGVQHYLDGWSRLMQATAHLPSPACMSLLGWVLDNIPPMSGSPVLIHGDVGFHNFLIDDGRLTTLLDWEFAHLGDPAEDLASIRNNMGDTLDWNVFMRAYRAAGGAEIDMARVHYFQVWGHVRNALASILAAPVFLDGRANDIKFVITPHVYVPMFIRAAQALINAGCPASEN